jgi:hypothetical protein
VHFLSSKDNLANIFTKSVASSHFSLPHTKFNVICHLSRLQGCNEKTLSQRNNKTQQGNSQSTNS